MNGNTAGAPSPEAGLPYPIRLIREKTLQGGDPIADFIQLGNLFEVTLRYLSTIVLSSFCRMRQSGPVQVPPRVLMGLSRPSLGHWCQVLHSLPRRLAAAGPLPIPEIGTLDRAEEQNSGLRQAFREFQDFLGKPGEGIPKRFSMPALFDLLVAFRNKTKAHGAIQQELAASLNPVLGEAMGSIMARLGEWFGYPLLVKARGESGGAFIPLDGRMGNTPDGELWAASPEGTPLLSLEPFAAWREGDFWFMNGWESPGRVEFLSYLSGKIRSGTVEAGHPFFMALSETGGPAARASDNAGGAGAGKGPSARARVEIGVGEVWDIQGDVALMSQDRNRIFGPVSEIAEMGEAGKHEDRIRKVLRLMARSQWQVEIGQVEVSKRPWCASGLVMELIVYDLDFTPITTIRAVESGLGEALRRLGELTPSRVVIGPIGTEYGILSVDEFARILACLWQRNEVSLSAVQGLTIAVADESRIPEFRDALSSAFGHPVSVSR